MKKQDVIVCIIYTIVNSIILYLTNDSAIYIATILAWSTMFALIKLEIPYKHIPGYWGFMLSYILYITIIKALVNSSRTLLIIGLNFELAALLFTAFMEYENRVGEIKVLYIDYVKETGDFKIVDKLKTAKLIPCSNAFIDLLRIFVKWFIFNPYKFIAGCTVIFTIYNRLASRVAFREKGDMMYITLYIKKGGTRGS